MRRSWAAFLFSSLPTNRICWLPLRPPRSQRVSTCTPSGIECGRSNPALPSLVRGSRLEHPSLLSLYSSMFLCHSLFSPCYSDLLSGGNELGLQKCQLQEKVALLRVFCSSGGTASATAAAAAAEYTHIHWQRTAPSWALVQRDIPVNVNTTNLTWNWRC